MHLLDWILLLIVVLSVIPALVKGFVYEALMMAATVAAIVIGLWKYPALAAHIHWVHAPPLRSFMAFVLIFLAILIAAGIAARIARGLVKAAGLRWFDRLLGGALGLVRGVVICLVLLVVMTAFPFDLPLVRGSAMAPDFLTVGQALSGLLPQPMQSDFRASLQKLQPDLGPAPRAGSSLKRGVTSLVQVPH